MVSVIGVNVLEPQLVRDPPALVRLRIHRHHLLAELDLVPVGRCGQEVVAVHEALIRVGIEGGRVLSSCSST